MKDKLSRLSRCIAAAALCAAASATPAATIVFSDNFDDGDVSDWSAWENHTGNTAVATDTSVKIGSTGAALYTYLDAPPGGTQLFSRAARTFVAPATGTYLLDLWARSAPCQGCTISYDVLVDGNLLLRRNQPNSFEQRSFELAGLSAGQHTLALGIHTTNASSGRFRAWFDDVTISTTAPIPEPDTYLMMLAGLGLAVLARRRRPRA